MNLLVELVAWVVVVLLLAAVGLVQVWRTVLGLWG